MKKLIYIILIFVINVAAAQDSTRYFIEKLGWKSLVLKQTYVSQLVLDTNAKRLIFQKNEKTAKALFFSIKNDERPVIIHMILTEMFEPDKAVLDQKNFRITDSSIGVRYSYNAISWDYNVYRRKYVISKENVIQIKRYWEKRLRMLYGRKFFCK